MAALALSWTAQVAAAQDASLPQLTPPWLDPPRAVQLAPIQAPDARTALDCLTSAVYYEAATEPLAGRQAVAQVVLNRVESPGFPKSVCGVVYQGAQRVSGCQFSFACDGSEARRPIPRLWSQAEQVAQAALGGYVDPDIAGATHYHADYVSPYWRWSLVETGRIGRHVFYRPPGPGAEPALGAVAGADGPAKPARRAHTGRGSRRSPPASDSVFSVWGLDVAQVSAKSDGLHIDPPKPAAGPL
jgi:hypothetical protein